jgi:hypothetical protein
MIGYLFWVIITIFGFMCLWAGLKGVFTSRSESYNSQSLQSNIGASIMLILLGLLLTGRFLYILVYLWNFL